jgi:hypothetical protein
MSKRFTDTAIWDKAWFRKLPPRLKETWRYFCDKCDHAGILDLDLEALVFNIGEEVTMEEIHTCFGDKITFISEAKIFLTGFIPFQYKCEISELNPDNNAHKSVISLVHKYGVDKPLTSPSRGVKDKDKDKVVDKDKERFNTFWEAYPKKKSKGDALKAWKQIKPSKELSDVIISKLLLLNASHDWTKEGGKFIPYPASWLRAGGWDDEVKDYQQTEAEAMSVKHAGALAFARKKVE